MSTPVHPNRSFFCVLLFPMLLFFLQNAIISSNLGPCFKYMHVIQMVFHPYQYDLQPCYTIIYTECKSNNFCFSA